MATTEGLAISEKNKSVMSTIPPRLNIGCGKDYREGWINIDISPGVMADMYIDAFSFPWKKLPASHFETVVVRHLVEHIPHQVSGSKGDGFYVFFEEVYRILKPSGKVIVTVPYWKHENTVLDPTHTRNVHPKTFHFFDPSHPTHYQTHAHFLVTSSKTRRESRLSRYINARFGLRIPGFKKVELEVTLKKV